MAEKKTRVIVIGAGYAGLMAAFRLAGKTRRLPVEVLLVNPADVFVARPMLHELATGHPPRIHALVDMLKGSGVQWIQGRVSHLNPDAKTIQVEGSGGSQTLAYDYLIYTPGSRVDRDSVPGVRDNAYTLDASGSLAAPALFTRLTALAKTGGQVVIVGSGPTGIETAGEIADSFPNLQINLLTQGKFGDFKDTAVQNYMRKALQRLNVSIREHLHIAEVQPQAVLTDGGESIRYDVLVWAGGFRALPLAQESGLTVNERDQILVDPSMRSLSHPAIFAAGDAAYPLKQPGAAVRMGLFPALVTAAHAADSLNRLLRDKPVKPLGFSYYGQGIALGRHDAVGFMSFPNDNRTGPMFTGRAGLIIRNFFVWLILEIVRLEKILPGFFFWFGGSRGRHTVTSPVPVSSEKLPAKRT